MNLLRVLQEKGPNIVKRNIALLGLVLATDFLISGLVGLYRSTWRRQIDLQERYGSKDSYAVITGGADGIGKQFALSLAKKGFNLVLMDFNEAALQGMVQEIHALNSVVVVKVIVVDFSSCTIANYQQLVEQLSGLDISILINNVGIGSGCFGQFDVLPIASMLKAYKVNLHPAIFLTKMLLPGLQARAKQSLIINMSSESGLNPIAYFFLYGATKRFLMTFGRCLELEQQAQKTCSIDVLTFTPSYISTALTGYRKGFFIITPDEFVQCALRQIGHESQCLGHWRHQLHYHLPEKLLGTQWHIKLEGRMNRDSAVMTSALYKQSHT